MIKPVKPWLLALAMGATAAEMQPPVISLDLSQMARVHTHANSDTEQLMANVSNYSAAGPGTNTVGNNTYQPVGPQTHAHNAVGPQNLTDSGDGNGYCHTEGPNATGFCVNARKGVQCDVLDDDATSCPEPTASAYDHHDEASVPIVKTTVLWIASYPQSAPVQEFKKVPAISYDQRGEFIFYYDAIDRAGNMAEQVPFSMEMVDHKCPVITQNWTHASDALHVEAGDVSSVDEKYAGCCRRWLEVPTSQSFAHDEYDGDVSDRIEVTVSAPSGCCDMATSADRDHRYTIDTLCIGTHTIQYEAADYANIFGVAQEDNRCDFHVEIEVEDTLVPETFCSGSFDRGEGTFNAASSFIEGRNLTVGALDDPAFACADMCYAQRWERMTSASAQNETGCVYFEYCTATTTCKLYRDEPAVNATFNLENSANVQGKLDLCDKVVMHECNTPYVDQGAICADVRDSLETSNLDCHEGHDCPSGSPCGAVDSLKLVPVAVLDAELSTSTIPIGFYEVVYTCTDATGQDSTEVRNVEVEDTLYPTLHITLGSFPDHSYSLIHYDQETTDEAARESHHHSEHCLHAEDVSHADGARCMELSELCNPFTCDNTKFHVSGLNSTDVALTDPCHEQCDANPKYDTIKYNTPMYDNDNTKRAEAYCKDECADQVGCTGFFFQKAEHAGDRGHEICGFFNETVHIDNATNQPNVNVSAVCWRPFLATDPNSTFVCDDSVNFMPDLSFTEISLTDDCLEVCDANPVYGAPNTAARAEAYCKDECNGKVDCTGFFFEKREHDENTGSEICGFYSATVDMDDAEDINATDTEYATVCSASAVYQDMKTSTDCCHGIEDFAHDTTDMNHIWMVPASAVDALVVSYNAHDQCPDAYDNAAHEKEYNTTTDKSMATA